ncbi:MAG: M20/M25/M40 family metallo-hydrolase [Chloroflexota bacterium]|nr:M20/M25/M40 family metallo-hydrolase [Chloroflexota bacterium]
MNVGAHSRGEVRRTNVNNLLALVGGSGPRLLLFAHADEICLMVKSVSEDGFLHLWTYYRDVDGHLPTRYTPVNQPGLVVSSTGNIDGYIATASGHVLGGRPGKQDRLVWNDIFVDVGAGSAAEVEALGIAAGSRVIWSPLARRPRGNIVGKAMDDRAPLAIVTLVGEALATRDDLPYEVWLGSTIQEENGLIGAASLADEITIDLAIALDVGLTGDIPGPDKRDFPARLGACPTIVYQDSSCHYSRILSDELIAVARSAAIPIQRSIFQHYGSDGSALIRRGVETALLTCPTRYTHSPIEMVSERDLLNTVALLTAFCATSRASLND